MRGFSLSYENSLKINFESMKQALFAWKEGKPLTYQTVSNMILRNKYEATVYTRNVSKKYAVVYDKRVVRDDFTTYPYGFR